MERQQNQADVEKMIVDSSVKNYMSGHILHVHPTQASPSSAQKQQYQLYLTMKDNPQLQQDDLPIWLALNAKRQKTSEHGTYVFGESSSGQDNESEPGPSTSGNQEQLDDFDFWMDSYATDDDELPSEKVSQELAEEMSQTVDEAKLLIFPDDDIKERTSKWVDKCVKKFNPYARYNVKHWKNPHAKIFYIKKQKEPEKDYFKKRKWYIVSITESDYKNLNKNDIEDMYLLIVSGKVDDYAKTRLMWLLSVFIRSTVIWKRVHDFQLGVKSYQQKVNLTAPTITFLCIEKYKMFSIVSKPVYGIIYKNNKKEKRVMRHQEVHKFCDATLKRVLEGLKIYNNNVKHGYVTPSISKEDVEYLQLFEEEIEERLKHRDQIRHWEMYVNGRPLGSRREHPE
ncbi:hypothetical protein Tco_0374996 [Tanacetum coccineum]